MQPDSPLEGLEERGTRRALRVAGAASIEMLQDLNMLVISGRRERSEAGQRALQEVAGWISTRIVPTTLPLRVIEAVKKYEETVS